MKTEEWMEEVKAHCESCYDDKYATSEVQSARLLDQRRRGRQSGCLAGEDSRPSPGQDDEEGQRPAGLLGDRDAAGTSHGIRVRHHTLVRERIQR